MSVDRKYVLTAPLWKLARGDYLQPVGNIICLPSNDGQTIWRLATYEDDIDHDLRTVWGVWKWVDLGSTIDPAEWGAWEIWEGSLPTRAEAIKVALR